MLLQSHPPMPCLMTLLVGPTIHSSLVDVLLCFRLHQIALAADVNKMYRAIELVESDQDLHHFVWRSDPSDHLKDYRMTRVTAWIHRFVDNCCCKGQDRAISLYLSTSELIISESYWTSLAQQAFAPEIEALKNDESLPKSSCLFSLHPFLDSSGLLRVGGRSRNAQMSFSFIHPVILPSKHPITSLLISSEHH